MIESSMPDLFYKQMYTDLLSARYHLVSYATPDYSDCPIILYFFKFTVFLIATNILFSACSDTLEQSPGQLSHAAHVQCVQVGSMNVFFPH